MIIKKNNFFQIPVVNYPRTILQNSCKLSNNYRQLTFQSLDYDDLHYFFLNLSRKNMNGCN